MYSVDSLVGQRDGGGGGIVMEEGPSKQPSGKVHEQKRPQEEVLGGRGWAGQVSCFHQLVIFNLSQAQNHCMRQGSHILVICILEVHSHPTIFISINRGVYVLTFKRAKICGQVDYEKSMFLKFGDSVTHF